jgi:hypothetical protein
MFFNRKKGEEEQLQQLREIQNKISETKKKLEMITVPPRMDRAVCEIQFMDHLLDILHGRVDALSLTDGDTEFLKSFAQYLLSLAEGNEEVQRLHHELDVLKIREKNLKFLLNIK